MLLPTKPLAYAQHPLGRGYNLDGKYVPGVTTVLQHTKSAKAQRTLADWQAKTPVAKQQANLDRGTSIHAALEAILLGQETPELTRELNTWLQSFIPFLKQLQAANATVDMVEGSVWHSRGYAGTADALITMDNLFGTRTQYVLDWKTSKQWVSGEKLHDYKVQLAAYLHAIKERYPGQPVKRGILCIGLRGKPAQVEWVDEEEMDRLWIEWRGRLVRFHAMLESA